MSLRRIGTIIMGILLLGSPGAATAGAGLTLALSPSVPWGTGFSPEGCFLDPGRASGVLGKRPELYLDQGECHSGLVGFDAAAFAGEVQQDVGAPAEFVSEPFAGGLALEGPASLLVHYVDDAAAVGATTSLLYTLHEIRADGTETIIGSGVAIAGLRNDAEAGYTGQSGSFNVGAWNLASGSRLRLRLSGADPEGAGGRILYGGVPFPESVSMVPGLVRPYLDFRDAGITLALDGGDGGRSSLGAVAGAVPASLLLPLLGLALARRRTALAALALLTAATAAAAEAPAADTQTGLVTFAQQGPPTAAQLAVLRGLELEVQGLRQLPIAIVRGTPARIAAAISRSESARFHPNEPLAYASAESSAAIGVGALHDLGFTGKGMQIAIVDSGIDATHADLKDHVVHNVKIVGPEYAYQPADAAPGNLYLMFDEGPYSNTDLSNGHGTMCAGIAAADGHTSPTQLGVAPDADLIGYSTGYALELIAVVAAFDHILDHSAGGNGPDWGIDVVSNSWMRGQSGAFFDPADPLAVATRALTDRGIVVVFAGGNGGDVETEMTLNSAVSPWSITVAATGIDNARASYSSNGLEMDNAAPVALREGHARFDGDQLGLYHPSIAAPGGTEAAGITTSCTPTGPGKGGACTPDGTATGYGTSFAAPHVAGLVALLRQARPDLTVAQIRQTLESTAVPTADGAPFWQVGFGRVDALAALKMVQSRKFEKELAAAHRAATQRVLAAREWKVLASDLWSWEQPFAPVSRDVSLEIGPGLDAVKIALSYVGLNNVVEPNVDGFQGTVRDAAGEVVGVTTRSGTVATVLIDLRGLSYAAGAWTVHLEGPALIRDPRFAGSINLQVAQLEKQVPVTEEPTGDGFVADRTLTFAFTPDPARITGVASPEGCELEPGPAIGSLAAPAAGTACHAGVQGYPMYAADLAAEFTSAPLDTAVVVGGTAGIVAHVADSLRFLASAAIRGRFEYQLIAIAPDGGESILSSGETLQDLTDGRNEGSFDLGAVAVAAGHRLRLRLQYPGGTTVGARLLFGGEVYGDAGLTLQIGHMGGEARAKGPTSDAGAALPMTGGGLPLPSLLMLAVAVLLGRAPRRKD